MGEWKRHPTFLDPVADSHKLEDDVKAEVDGEREQDAGLQAAGGEVRVPGVLILEQVCDLLNVIPALYVPG
jgi:hypothetical protein